MSHGNYPQYQLGPEDGSVSPLRLFIRKHRKAIKITLLVASVLALIILAGLIILILSIASNYSTNVAEGVNQGSWAKWAVNLKDWLSKFLGIVSLDKVIQWLNLYNQVSQ